MRVEIKQKGCQVGSEHSPHAHPDRRSMQSQTTTSWSGQSSLETERCATFKNPFRGSKPPFTALGQNTSVSHKTWNGEGGRNLKYLKTKPVYPENTTPSSQSLH